VGHTARNLRANPNVRVAGDRIVDRCMGSLSCEYSDDEFKYKVPVRFEFMTLNDCLECTHVHMDTAQKQLLSVMSAMLAIATHSSFAGSYCSTELNRPWPS